MNAITIKAKAVNGNWIETLGAVMVDGKKHHSAAFANIEQAVKAAQVAHPEMSASDLLIVNGNTGRESTVQEHLDAAAYEPNLDD